MAALRTPVTGCPWDLEQNFATIAPYTIEEAYEVADAIARGDLDDLREELGDLLLQVVYHARMAEEQNAFAFGDVVEAITRKMIRRHPHVFADKDGNIAPAGVKSAWERIKAEEKAERAARRPPEATTHKSLLVRRQGRPAGADARDGIAAQGLHRRLRLERSRARCCTRSARRPTRSRPRWIAATREELADETGDLLFALVNLARHVGADPECRAARHQRQIRTPLCLYRARARGEGPLARGRVAGRDGRAVERGERRREPVVRQRTQATHTA